MKLRITSIEDFLSGLLLLIVGFATVITAYNYPLGTLARMGPGMMPLILGILLLVIGTSICIKTLSFSPETLAPADDSKGLQISLEETGRLLRPLSCIALGMGAFALMVRPLGMVLATVTLVLIVTRAEKGFPLRLALLLAPVLALAAVLIFVVGLNLPFPIWP